MNVKRGNKEITLAEIVFIYVVGFLLLGVLLAPIVYGVYWFNKADHEINCYLAERNGYRNLPTCAP